jgi:hypothetical protein
MDPFLGLLLLIDTDTTDVDTETDLAFAFRISGFGAAWPPPAAGNFRLSAKIRRSPESSEFSFLLSSAPFGAWGEAYPNEVGLTQMDGYPTWDPSNWWDSRFGLRRGIYRQPFAARPGANALYNQTQCAPYSATLVQAAVGAAATSTNGRSKIQIFPSQSSGPRSYSPGLNFFLHALSRKTCRSEPKSDDQKQ